MTKLYVLLAFPLESMIDGIWLHVKKLTADEAKTLIQSTETFADEESADMIGRVFHCPIKATEEAMHPGPGVSFLVGKFTGSQEAAEVCGAFPDDFEWCLFEVMGR